MTYRYMTLESPRCSSLARGNVRELDLWDVLVEVKVCGVCASELPVWSGEAGSLPERLGHEVTGVVRQIGDRVTSVCVGDVVTGLFQEGFGELTVTHEAYVTRVPQGVPVGLALGEPLSCAMSAAIRTPVEPGDTVAVVGLGFMGLLMLQMLAAKGPGRLIGIDPRPEARALAASLGADDVCDPSEVPARCRFTSWEQLGSNDGVDVAVEASGTQAGLTLAGELPHEHGFLSILGYHQKGPRQVDMELWNWKALTVLNAHERRKGVQMDCMQRGLRLLAAGKLAMEPLVTHRFALDEVDAAFAALEQKPEGFIKSIVTTG